MVKKAKVNQSTKAEMRRVRVGSAKAAKLAQAGKPTTRAQSELCVNTNCPIDSKTNPKGQAKCVASQWRRHCHNVHTTMGQIGQVNQRSKRPNRCNSSQLATGQSSLQTNEPVNSAGRTLAAPLKSIIDHVNPRESR